MISIKKVLFICILFLSLETLTAQDQQNLATSKLDIKLDIPEQDSLFFFNNEINKDSLKVNSRAENVQPKKWYDSFAIRGYTQIRYNRLL